MARYIEKETAIKAAVGALREVSQITAVDVAEALEDLPNADVAPKSEVERLQSQVNRLKKYDEERDIALHARLISNAKTEVASEIFEDIKSALAQMGICFNDQTILCEIEKKYTEEKE